MNNKDKKNTVENMIGGAIWLTVSVIIVKLLGVLYKIPLAGVLGDEGMGYFNSAYTVYSFFYLLCTAGVPKGIMILLSDKSGENENKINRIMNVSLRTFLFLGFGLAILFALLSAPLSSLFGSPESRAAMICIAPSIIFASVSGVLRGYLNSNMRLFEIALSQIIEGALKLAVGLLLAMLGAKANLPVHMIAALTILGATIGSFASLLQLIISSKSANLCINFRQNKNTEKGASVIKALLKTSLPITLSAALMSLSSLSDLFLVMRRLEDIGYTESEATALYGNYTTLAVSVLNLAIALITPISVAVMPTLAKSFANREIYGFTATLKNALRFTAFISAPIVLGTGLFAQELLSVLFGSKAATVGAPLLLLLTPAIIFMSYILILNSAIEALCRPELAMLSMGVGAIAKIIISGILLGLPDIGIAGAPLGTVISYALSAFISLLLLSHILGYNIPIFSTAVLPYLTATVSLLSARIIYERICLSNDLLAAFAAAVISAGLIYLLLSGFFAMTNSEFSLKSAKLTKFT